MTRKTFINRVNTQHQLVIKVISDKGFPRQITVPIALNTSAEQYHNDVDKECFAALKEGDMRKVFELLEADVIRIAKKSEAPVTTLAEVAEVSAEDLSSKANGTSPKRAKAK